MIWLIFPSNIWLLVFFSDYYVIYAILFFTYLPISFIWVFFHLCLAFIWVFFHLYLVSPSYLTYLPLVFFITLSFNLPLAFFMLFLSEVFFTTLQLYLHEAFSILDLLFIFELCPIWELFQLSLFYYGTIYCLAQFILCPLAFLINYNFLSIFDQSFLLFFLHQLSFSLIHRLPSWFHQGYRMQIFIPLTIFLDNCCFSWYYSLSIRTNWFLCKSSFWNFHWRDPY